MSEIREIDLAEAIRQIRTTCGLNDRPFFFMVGAGISDPPIPLASRMVEECRQIAKDAVEPVGLSKIDRYSFWLRQAFPSPADRQKYHRRLIEGKFVSHANLRLAHVLLDKRIGNLVVTTNFDDFISRALTLFGEPHIVCDHPDTIQRIDAESQDVQIVHVHGTYWFYDCCNLKEELVSRSQRLQETPFTMAGFLDDVLKNRSPIVVGYSGWEGDVFMAALKRRLKKQLRYNLYWFCHRRDAINELPEELRAHENVLFVVPPPAKEGRPSVAEEAILPADLKPNEAAGASRPPLPRGQEPEPPTLSATDVFDGFVAGFGLDAPLLTRDPLAFFAEHLHGSLPPDDEQAGGSDTYVINRVLFRIKRARELLVNSTEEAERCLEAVFDAVRRSQYEEAVRSANGISVPDLDPGQLRAFVESLWTAGKGLAASPAGALHALEVVILGSELRLQQSPDSVSLRERLGTALNRKGMTLGELNRHEEAVQTYDQVVERFGQASELSLRERVARALVNKGVALGKLNRQEEAVQAFDQMVERFGQASELSLREPVAWALFIKGVALGELNRDEEAVQACDQVAERFGQASELSLRERVARALVNKGIALGKLNRQQEAVRAYDQVVERFGQASELSLREPAARALFFKGIALSQLKRHEEAVQAYDQVVERFGQASELSLRERVARALFNKGIALGQLKRHEEAARVFQEVADRFGQASELSLQEGVARALTNKGVALEKLNRYQEAVQAHGQVVERYDGATAPVLREAVGKALNGIGFSFLCEAKRFMNERDQEAGESRLKEARDKFLVALQRRPENAKVLGNLGYVEFLLGNLGGARDLLSQAISIGGEEIRQGEIEDSQIHELPQDEGFRQLVLSISRPTEGTGEGRAG